jgi:hypothetical protein
MLCVLTTLVDLLARQVEHVPPKEMNWAISSLLACSLDFNDQKKF